VLGEHNNVTHLEHFRGNHASEVTSHHGAGLGLESDCHQVENGVN
jgi:hypothetical protein